jgi:hypothetical protein
MRHRWFNQVVPIIENAAEKGIKYSRHCPIDTSKTSSLDRHCPITLLSSTGSNGTS